MALLSIIISPFTEIQQSEASEITMDQKFATFITYPIVVYLLYCIVLKLRKITCCQLILEIVEHAFSVMQLLPEMQKNVLKSNLS